MITPHEFAIRRESLSDRVGAPILLVANGVRSRNLPLTPLPFRQDSTFLYYTGCTTPRAAALIVDGRTTLFVDPPAEDDALWHGHVASLADQRDALGVDDVRPLTSLVDACAPHRGRLQTLAVPDVERSRLAEAITGVDLRYPKVPGSPALVDAVIAQRKCRSAAELDEMRATMAVTERAHRAAMGVTRPGGTEALVRAVFDGVLMSAGLTNAYGSIVTVRGEVLHNDQYVNPLEDGQLLLLDGGAEARSGYATDITRTWPVSGTFSGRQRAAYEAVLAAQEASIALCTVGRRFREVHDASCLVLARFLADEGLIRCSPEAAVESGAHAVFFPHGVGHLIALDVHDLENFGDRACYDPRYSRSEAFGTAWLRIDLDLEAGMVVTVEPGFYVVPAILSDPALVERFSAQVDFDRAREWAGFGGIRIEDDVAIHDGGPEVLSAAIPSSVAELEALVGTMSAGPLG